MTPDERRDQQLVGGVAIAGDWEANVLVTAERVQVVELKLQPGFFHPSHSHPEHESVGLVLEGELELTIGGTARIARAGDVWHHPVGVVHSTRAHAFTHAIEVHCPPRPEYIEMAGDG